MGMSLLKMSSSILVIGISSILFYLCFILWLKPERVRRAMRRQGITGPAPSSFLAGNLLEMKELTKKKESSGGEVMHGYSLFPHLDKWRKEHGQLFLYSMANFPILHVTSPEMVKEMSLCFSLDFGRTTFLQATLKALFGDGIVKANGDIWARQRKIVAPEFSISKVKGMLDLMVDSTAPLLELWERRIARGGGGGEVEVEVYEDLRNYSADVISKTCFGSSYSRGKEIFTKLRILQKAVSRPNILAELIGRRIPLSKADREIIKLEKEIHSLILEIVKGAEASNEENLLQAILRSADNGGFGAGVKADAFIVDNCKTIYFAGHETTASAAAWCLLLLALHPEWQDLVRTEVIELGAGRSPDMQALQKMKTLTMVIQETLRLYPPGPLTSRQALRDMRLGGIDIPGGLAIYIPVPALHRDPDIWGPDALVFNPNRFAGGVLGACQLSHAYMPFGAGSRICLGQHFAMVELKVVLSILISKFRFSFSPAYRHSPAFRLTLEPEFGVQLLVKEV